MDPKNWDIHVLREWLRSPSTQEGGDYEFKEMLPNRSDREGLKRLKKEFCAFANTNLGYIFFGINKRKKAVGIVIDNEFQRNLSHIISCNITPQTIDWDLYHVISVSSRKCVYVVRVQESLHYQKPHIYFDEKDGVFIPIRLKGHISYIKSGNEIRKLCLLDDEYYIEYGKHIRYILEKICSSTTPPTSLPSSVILISFGRHLEKLSPTNNDDRQCLASAIGEYSQINSLIMKYHKAFSVGINHEGDDYRELKNELNKCINEYLNKYRRFL